MELEVTYTQSDTKDGLYAYSLKIEAKVPNDDSTDSTDSTDSNDGLDPNIFVFRRSVKTMNPFGTTDGWFDDDFFNVATPVDMYDIPVGSPDIENGMPYYRGSKVELWFRNSEDVRKAKFAIAADIASLVKMWDNINEETGRTSHETVVYGSGGTLSTRTE